MRHYIPWRCRIFGHRFRHTMLPDYVSMPTWACGGLEDVECTRCGTGLFDG